MLVGAGGQKEAEMFTSDCLLGQVEVLQEEALLRQQEVQTDSLVFAGLQKEIRLLLQQNSSHEHLVSTAQVQTHSAFYCHRLFIYTFIVFISQRQRRVFSITFI